MKLDELYERNQIPGVVVVVMAELAVAVQERSLEEGQEWIGGTFTPTMLLEMAYWVTPLYLARSETPEQWVATITNLRQWLDANRAMLRAHAQMNGLTPQQRTERATNTLIRPLNGN